jgi:uncharacterized membrane protein YphA (DoxX/SURF4 family)
MTYLHQTGTHPAARTHPTTSAAYRLCLLLLCSAYLQGGIVKALDFGAAIGEMRHFGLAPAAPLALLTIIGEIGGAALVVGGMYRWAGALYLALFTFAANFVANRFWELSGPARMMSENGFFEHLGLAGAFLLVAWIDMRSRMIAATHPARAWHV